MKAVDPVCGMQLKMQKSTLQSEFRGQTYFFCTAACRKAFDVHPEKYVSFLAKEVSKNGNMPSLRHDG